MSRVARYAKMIAHAGKRAEAAVRLLAAVMALVAEAQMIELEPLGGKGLG